MTVVVVDSHGVEHVLVLDFLGIDAGSSRPPSLSFLSSLLQGFQHGQLVQHPTTFVANGVSPVEKRGMCLELGGGMELLPPSSADASKRILG